MCLDDPSHSDNWFKPFTTKLYGNARDDMNFIIPRKDTFHAVSSTAFLGNRFNLRIRYKVNPRQQTSEKDR